MGIPGILKEIGKGERVALAKLAVQHLEQTRRPLRIAIDAAIWNFQSQAGQGGKNPALRTLYYRLLKLLALPIHPLFVYDGKNKPLLKRGKAVSRWGTCIANETSKKLISHFCFPCHTAPGEAEAECATLQRSGIVDMVMSQDGDAIMFGSGVTLRDWSKEGTRGNKTPTHVNLLDLPRLKERSGLDPDGMILVALLSGGDYDQDGVAGFGAALACEAARAGFGTDLLNLVRQNDEDGIREWRERLQYELEFNESGHFKRKHKTISIPDSFPNRTILEYYINPVVSKEPELRGLEQKWMKAWNTDIHTASLRQYVGETFEWQHKPGAWKFVRTLAPSLLAHKLLRNTAGHCVSSVDQITDRRQHFITDGLPELRIEVIPADVVGINLDAEEDSPDFLAQFAEEQENEAESDGQNISSTQNDDYEEPPNSQSDARVKKSSVWNPFAAEKMWVPESVVQLGLPAVVEDWHQLQRDIRADPKKFASRKLKKSTKQGPVVQAGSIERYLVPPGTTKTSALDSTQQQAHEAQLARTPKAQKVQMQKQANDEPSGDMRSIFKISKSTTMRKIGTSGEKTQSQVATELFRAQRSDSLLDGPSLLPLSSEQKHQHGTSQNPINLTSSPSAESLSERMSEQKLTTPTKRTVPANVVDDAGTTPDLPASVTRRKKRVARAQTVDGAGKGVPNSSPSRPSIGSFFRPADRQHGQSAHQDREQIPSDPGTGLDVGFASVKEYAIPRDSLPGTWKNANFDAEAASKSQRGARISCVDLTGD